MLDPDIATKALREWCQRRGPEQGVDEFLQFLDDKDALYLLPAIRARLQDEAQETKRKQTLDVQTAQKLNDRQQAELEDLVGDAHLLKQSVDTSLLAGLRATHQNRRVRATLKDQLTNLHTHLTS